MFHSKPASKLVTRHKPDCHCYELTQPRQDENDQNDTRECHERIQQLYLFSLQCALK